MNGCILVVLIFFLLHNDIQLSLGFNTNDNNLRVLTQYLLRTIKKTWITKVNTKTIHITIKESIRVQ
jgi:hypothetical protein